MSDSKKIHDLLHTSMNKCAQDLIRGEKDRLVLDTIASLAPHLDESNENLLAQKTLEFMQKQNIERAEFFMDLHKDQFRLCHEEATERSDKLINDIEKFLKEEKNA